MIISLKKLEVDDVEIVSGQLGEAGGGSDQERPAVIKRDQIRQLFHQDSLTTVNSSDLSQQTISYSSNSLRPVTSFHSTRLPLAETYIQVRKNASVPITRKLFSALLGRKKPKDDEVDGDLPGIPEGLPIHLGQRHWRISLQDLVLATDTFSDTNIIGHGRHSKVYKGHLPDGSLVAVKRLEAKPRVIGKEVEISSIVEHPNVLRLCKFCVAEKEWLLVYPFMVNGSVASWLRGRPETQPPLDWATRLRIAVGAAKGLAYLHYECSRTIIHCDIKAANVLLDKEFKAVVADFNLAEFFMDRYDRDYAGGIRGTFGHIAPEYFPDGTSSEKTDVFSYGVFLLELITAQKSYDLARASYDEEVMLLHGVKESYELGHWRMMVDIDLQSSFVDEEVEKLLQIALMCTQTYPETRPTMSDVVSMLESGQGLAARWRAYIARDEIVDDDISIMDQRHQNTEWIIMGSSSKIIDDELSGPR